MDSLEKGGEDNKSEVEEDMTQRKEVRFNSFTGV